MEDGPSIRPTVAENLAHDANDDTPDRLGDRFPQRRTTAISVFFGEL